MLIKDAEELLGKGEGDDARHKFRAALERCASLPMACCRRRSSVANLTYVMRCRYQAAFKTSEFAEDWLPLIQDAGVDSGPQWKDCHESLSIDGSFLLCEESDVGTAITGDVADVGKLMCEIRIKKMKERAEGEDSDIFFGVMRDNISLDDFWFEEEFEDLIW